MDERKFYVYVYLDLRKKGKFLFENYYFGYEPFYIGKGFGKRMLRHLWEVSNDKYCNNNLKKNIINKIKKETGKNPIVTIIKDNLTEKESIKLEKEMISLIGRRDLKSGSLVNLTYGGEGQSGHIHTEEHKRKISKSHIGLKRGIKLTEEHKRKISKSQIGMKKKPHTEETKDKIRNKATGRIMSEETKDKIRKSMIGKNTGKRDKHIIEKMKKKLKGKFTGSKNPNAKTFIFSNKYEKIEVIGGFNKFCEENDLSTSIMESILKNKNRTYNGWSVDYKEVYNG